ncbi:hypothetical protein O3P69_016267, partial [Scylla paramamosain]
MKTTDLVSQDTEPGHADDLDTDVTSPQSSTSVQTPTPNKRPRPTKKNDVTHDILQRVAENLQRPESSMRMISDNVEVPIRAEYRKSFRERPVARNRSVALKRSWGVMASLITADEDTTAAASVSRGGTKSCWFFGDQHNG